MKPQLDSPWRLVRVGQNHMNTTFVFTLAVDESRVVAAEHTLRECHELVSRLEQELSEFLPESGIYQLNQAKAGERVKLSRSAVECLAVAEEISDLTRGAFNVLAKSQAAGARVGWSAASGEAWRENEQAHLGFGAIGKGFAIDCVRELIAREGFEDFILDAGGSSLFLSGFSAPETPWMWGWSWKKESSGNPLGLSFSHASGEPVALGISGTHEKGNHLVGENTSRYQSALVVHRRATEADALSTALFVAGWDEIVPQLQTREQKIGPVGAAVIESDETPRWSGYFQSLWGQISIVLFALLFQAPTFAEEAVDLSELGMSDFTPYIVERNSWWILLPLLSLALVFVHLKRPPRKKRNHLERT